MMSHTVISKHGISMYSFNEVCHHSVFDTYGMNFNKIARTVMQNLFKFKCLFKGAILKQLYGILAASSSKLQFHDTIHNKHWPK